MNPSRLQSSCFRLCNTLDENSQIAGARGELYGLTLVQVKLGNLHGILCGP